MIYLFNCSIKIFMLIGLWLNVILVFYFELCIDTNNSNNYKNGKMKYQQSTIIYRYCLLVINGWTNTMDEI